MTPAKRRALKDLRLPHPLIGVSTSEVRSAGHAAHTENGEPPQREMALGLVYLRAVERAGGIPVVIPPLEEEAIEPLLDCVRGICLSGGPDLDPASYGGPDHPELGPTEPDLDRFELALARRADERGMPILGICRGAQILNIARGGTLIQHLPDRRRTGDHRQAVPGRRTIHEVELRADSRLAAILGRECLRVNSFHHQAVRRVGRGLRAVGRSPDGVIEAVEAPGRDFQIGVQWHAETLIKRSEQLALMRAFVAAAQRYQASQSDDAGADGGMPAVARRRLTAADDPRSRARAA
ncbi:MAG TPA: gamma-glutamyl-gamma-aminobutyrate hydrolase family protein [Solirubrobacteraceae bacterium]|nr:gamma-glutamyl-gamma-aminobutyrate hydrolase family protein [Solirubrobacteraceae bacterium]